MGLLQLKYINKVIKKRKEIAKNYREGLKGIKGVSYHFDINNVEHNYAYFPVFIDAENYGISRDLLYNNLKNNNIYGRRYFYPLITEFDEYAQCTTGNLKTAKKMSNKVICLPIYPDLDFGALEKIISKFKNNFKN